MTSLPKAVPVPRTGHNHSQPILQTQILLQDRLVGRLFSVFARRLRYFHTGFGGNMQETAKTPYVDGVLDATDFHSENGLDIAR
jgi:hypothetical protein